VVTLADLLRAPSKDEVLDLLVATLRLAGFPVASWQPGSIPRTLTEAESANLADLAQTIRSIAAGGFLEYAEAGWLDLLADGLYDERRKPSVFTQGTIRLTDAAGAGPFTIVPGQLWASDIGRTRRFTNLVGGSLPLSGTLDLTWQAESPGASWNLASGAIVNLLTSLPGVTVSNPALPSGTWITQQGADEESDVQLKVRCRAKWSTIGTGSTADAYKYYALTGFPDVRRVRVTDEPSTGVVTVTLAGATGTVTPAVATAVDAYLQTKRPLTVTITASPAVEQNIFVEAFLYVGGAFDLAQATSAAQAAVDAYARSLEIGETVYQSAIVEALMSVPGAYNVQLLSPASDVVLGANEVAVPFYLVLTGH
jgi:phage-related baseplate assembly protein